MRLCLTSDLHGHLPDIPECDVLVIAGDVIPLGIEADVDEQHAWLIHQFSDWLWECRDRVPHVVGIAGNHDFALEIWDWLGHELPWIYLCDSGVRIDGVNFYGLPWVPRLRNWAFYGDNYTLQEKFGQIPEDTDVVVAHGPPFEILDQVVAGEYVGAPQSRHAIERVRPKLFVCGHIHEASGHKAYYSGEDRTDVYNVSHVDVFYEPVNPPVIVDTDKTW